MSFSIRRCDLWRAKFYLSKKQKKNSEKEKHSFKFNRELKIIAN